MDRGIANFLSNLIFGNDDDGVETSSTPTLHEVPKLVDDIVKLDGEEGTNAARRLYELTDVAHKQNRIPMLTSGNYNVLAALTECLTHIHNDDNENDDKLHFVCLTLNNLAIPDSNKRIMALERGSRTLIGNLCQVISAGKKETYLCCIILMNMSFLDASLQHILQYTPSQPRQRTNSNSYIRSPTSNNSSSDNTTTSIMSSSSSSPSNTKRNTKPSPLESPNSLLRIIQELLAHAARGTLDFRWAFGLLSSLSKDPENAALIAQTAIPKVAVENIRLALLEQQQQQQQQNQSTTTSCATQSKNNNKNDTTDVAIGLKTSQWKTNTLEDFSLFVILHIAQVNTDALHQANALDVIRPIMLEGEGSIQNLKATMICAFLEAPWSYFPQYGIPAAACVSELMGNTFDQQGKKNVYSNNVFKLRTATKAYGDLCRMAAKADLEDEEEKNRKKNATATTSNDDDNTESTTISTVQARRNKLLAAKSCCTHTKVVALPTAVALLFQIIAEVVLTSTDNNNNNNNNNTNNDNNNSNHGSILDDDYQADDISAGYAVRAIMALLPALLQAEDPPRQSRQTEIACNHITQILLSYTKKATSVPDKARAKEAAEKFDESSTGSALPLLEASYDLWVQFNS